MPPSRPFVYIAALRRTGSTMLAQLLSKPPAAYIFREPRIGLGQLRVKRDVAAVFEPLGIDLLPIKRRINHLPREAGLAALREFFAAARDRVEQLGVKEIDHSGHEDVSRMFPDLRLVVTTRDPRDLYLSLYHRRKELLSRYRMWFETATLLPYLREQYAAITALMARHDHFVIRYEDLCAEPGRIAEVRAFAQSPVEDEGMLGTSRRRDLSKHGRTIDSTRVDLFAHESDEIARHNAAYVFEQMRDYGERFGYR